MKSANSQAIIDCLRVFEMVRTDEKTPNKLLSHRIVFAAVFFSSFAQTYIHTNVHLIRIFISKMCCKMYACFSLCFSWSFFQMHFLPWVPCLAQIDWKEYKKIETNLVKPAREWKEWKMYCLVVFDCETESDWWKWLQLELKQSEWYSKLNFIGKSEAFECLGWNYYGEKMLCSYEREKKNDDARPLTPVAL